MIMIFFLCFNKLDYQLIRKFFLFTFSDMIESESEESRLQKEATLHYFSSTPTQRAPSKNFLINKLVSFHFI